MASAREVSETTDYQEVMRGCWVIDILDSGTPGKSPLLSAANPASSNKSADRDLGRRWKGCLTLHCHSGPFGQPGKTSRKDAAYGLH